MRDARAPILHLITGLHPGGAEGMLFRYLKHAGTETNRHVVVSLGSGGAIKDKITALGITVTDLELREHPVIGLLKLAALMIKLRPRVVNTWLYHSDFIGFFARLLWPRAKLVWNVRCSEVDTFAGKGLKRIISILARLSRFTDRIIYNSEKGRAAHEAMGYANTPGVVVLNGLESESFFPSPSIRNAARSAFGLEPDEIVIGMVARADPSKDFATLFLSVRALQNHGFKARLILAGLGTFEENPFYDPFRDTFADVFRRTVFVGATSDVNSVYNAADIMVLFSHSEGFPNVVGEALLCARPLVASDVGDAKTIVNRHGFLIPRGDRKAATEALKTLAARIASNGFEYNEAGREWVNAQFSMTAFKRHYHEALGIATF